MKIIITGSCGFIAGNLVDRLLELGHEVIGIDCLTYAADPLLAKRRDKGHTFLQKDIRDIRTRHLPEKVDLIFHLAAESNVDVSIGGGKKFIETNVIGTMNMLDVARELKVPKFIHMSTDECLAGNDPPFTVDSPLTPRNPYSVSKASAELVCKAYAETYGYKAIIVRSCNAYGPRQTVDKFIPRAIYKTLCCQKVPLYGNGKQVREWIYVQDLINALLHISRCGQDGQTYHVGTGNVLENNVLAGKICTALNGEIEYVTDRLGHDQLYSLDSSSTRSLGWKPLTSFQQGLEYTISWYQNNQLWCMKTVERGVKF